MELQGFEKFKPFLKEPLVWVGALVLCVPILGSGTLMKLRNSMMADSTRVEAVALADPVPSESVDAVPPRMAVDSNLDLNGDSQPAEYGSPQDYSVLPDRSVPADDRMQVSLPPAIPPRSPSTPAPSREPGSLFEAAEGLGVDSDDSAFDAVDNQSDQMSQSRSSSTDDNEFDFLFGDESEDAASQMSRDRQPKSVTEPEPYAAKNPERPKSKTDSRDWLFPQSEDKADPDLIQPPTPDPGTIAQPSPFDPRQTNSEPFVAATPQPFQAGAMPASPDGSIMNATEYPLLNGGVVSGMPMNSPECTTCDSNLVYQPVVAPAVESQTAANYTFGITGMFFQRDYEDNRRLASNPTGDQLFTNDADEQTFDGYGLTLTRRGGNGNGLELAYWALNPGAVSAEISGASVATAITGLDQLWHAPTGENLFNIYSYSLTQRITRDTDINNLELNLLRNGGSYRSWRNRQGSYELVGGLRWFDFDEELLYSALTDTATFPTVPAEFNYRVRARNTLIGLQGGFRNELSFGSNLRFYNHVYGGVFNNNANTEQSITDSNGIVPLIGGASGDPFSFNNEKNDVAFLGQLDFGILFQLSCRSRVRFGYRVLGVSGVALAAEQLPYQYDADGLSRVQSNGNLLLNGGYYGLEFAY